MSRFLIRDWLTQDRLFMVAVAMMIVGYVLCFIVTMMAEEAQKYVLDVLLDRIPAPP